MTATPNPDRIMNVGLGFWGSKILLSAVELQLFTYLADRPANLTDIQKRLDLHPRSARDFLDCLVAMGFLQREDGMYRNAPDTDLFLDRRKPSYLGGLLEMANDRLYGFWNHLTEGLRTGLPQNELKGGGKSLFETLYADPKRLQGFLSAMSGLSQPANVAIARKFPWSDYQSFVDVGTAQGDLAVQVALANPKLSGSGFDLPAVQPIFESYVRQNGVDNRVRFSAGDFFKDDLPDADVLMMGHILHDWDLDEKRMLIQKAYDAIPDNGALIVYEAIIDDDRSQNVFGLQMSLNMLIETPGGFDYSAADCQGWMRDIGFRKTHVEHLFGSDSMVVGFK